jgi:hypothetical protein
MARQRKKWIDLYPELAKDSEALISIVLVMLAVVLLECSTYV